ncbi:tetratricopeptide repeat protein [Hufsiella ginkgonis]|uniref:Tetratricopeptide repeat protein n=1 Tax=Hufsiella ginkgonis TaxID=2695274 RepID=A0A7K1XTD8_9SPHI|nr:tetratricopeptide repeat protein [Hufsiella ginkgonis]MXV14224.1 hypothetical protein [Hufsiella ginkgonis]
MIKKLFILAALPLSGIQSAVLANTDSLSAVTSSKHLAPVKIGPEAYILPPPPPPVDLEKVRRMTIDERFRNRVAEQVTVRSFEEMKQLRTLLANIEIYTTVNEGNLQDIEQLSGSLGYAADTKNQALVFNALAVYYAVKGNLEKSFTLLRQSLAIRDQPFDKSLRTANPVLVALAELARLSGRTGDAVDYYTSIAAANQAAGKHIPAASAYVTIATLKCAQKNYAEAEKLLLWKALPMFRGNKPGRMSCFNALSRVYYLQGRYSEAKWYCLQGNTLSLTLNDVEAHVTFLAQLAAIKNQEGDSFHALIDFKEAESLAFRNNCLARLVEIKGDMGEIYRKMGDYTAAGSAIEEYSRLRTTLLSNVQ